MRRRGLYSNQTLQQVLEEALGGCTVPAVLHEDVEHDTILIHRPPQIVQHTSDADEHLVQVSRVARLRSAPAQPPGEVGTELEAPMPNAFMGHYDATFRQDQLDIAQAEAEDVIQPDRMADNVGGKPVSRIRGGFGCHSVSLAHLPHRRQPPLTCQCPSVWQFTHAEDGENGRRPSSTSGRVVFSGPSRSAPTTFPKAFER